MAFVEAVHEQLMQRSKLTAVFAHLEATEGGETSAKEMVAWIRRRIRQLDALISPTFLDLSARSAKLSFTEPETTPDEDSYYTYYPQLELHYWSLDDERGQATSQSALRWLLDSGLAGEEGTEPTSE